MKTAVLILNGNITDKNKESERQALIRLIVKTDGRTKQSTISAIFKIIQINISGTENYQETLRPTPMTFQPLPPQRQLSNNRRGHAAPAAAAVAGRSVRKVALSAVAPGLTTMRTMKWSLIQGRRRDR